MLHLFHIDSLSLSLSLRYGEPIDIHSSQRLTSLEFIPLKTKIIEQTLQIILAETRDLINDLREGIVTTSYGNQKLLTQVGILQTQVLYIHCINQNVLFPATPALPEVLSSLKGNTNLSSGIIGMLQNLTLSFDVTVPDDTVVNCVRLCIDIIEKTLSKVKVYQQNNHPRPVNRFDNVKISSNETRRQINYYKNIIESLDDLCIDLPDDKDTLQATVQILWREVKKLEPQGNMNLF